MNTTNMTDDGLTCCPEWCDESERFESDQHGSVCPDSPMEITKGDFVRAMEAAASIAVEAYREFAHEPEADEEAVEQVREAAMCRAGIGSCGRGWCDHG